MAKFLFIYRESTVSRAQPSPEEMQALAAAWGTWMQKFSSAIVPGGDGLKHTGRLVKAGLVTDGPYVEAKEIIVSFTIIQADDYDAAVEIARACPPGHTIVVSRNEMGMVGPALRAMTGNANTTLIDGAITEPRPSPIRTIGPITPSA